DHKKFPAVHARDEHGSNQERERGNENSSWDAESVGTRALFAKHGQSGSDGAIDEQARDDGKHGVAGKISRDGKDQEQHSENHNGNVRGSEARMNPCKKRGEIATLAHG